MKSNSVAILIRVIDQGPGVSEVNAKKLFQPFQQVNAAADKKQGGTGLGLALVRYLAREHNGIAWLEWSREGVGSCFSLLLPLEVSGELPEEDDDVHDTAAANLFKRTNSSSHVSSDGSKASRAMAAAIGFQSLGLSQTEASVYGLRGLHRQSAQLKRMASKTSLESRERHGLALESSMEPSSRIDRGSTWAQARDEPSLCLSELESP